MNAEKTDRTKTFDEFLLRIDRKWLKVENIEPLIAIGAFDEIAPNRRQLAVGLESNIQSILLSGGSMDLLETLKPKEEEIADYPLEERLEQEEQYLGVYLSGHPTEEFKKTRLAKQTQLVHELVENQPTKLLIYVKKTFGRFGPKRENKWPLLMGMIQQEVFH